MKAFTLVELLVSIAIVGILASLAVQNFDQYQMKARDTQRAGDKSIYLGYLEAYFVDNEVYPNCASHYVGNSSACLITALATAGFVDLPIDPNNESGMWGVGWGTTYQYWSTGAGAWYGMRFPVESGVGNDSHRYPNGSYCVDSSNSSLPICSWYGSCFYKGYGPGCVIGMQIGSESL